MIIEIILVVSSLIILNKWMANSIKKSKDNIEKIVGVITIIIGNIFLIIYYIDRFNLPTILKMNKNVDTQNWLMIITTCIASIISSTIGGLIAFGIARNQIKENNMQNSENLRIQNMPIVKYDITTCKLMAIKPQEIKTKFNKDNKYSISIKLKNIGLNIIKSIKVDFDSEINNNKVLRLKGKNTQVSMEKGEEILPIERCFNLEHAEKPYKMNLIVYYEDVLNNWYKQTVEIDYIATENTTVGGYTGKINYIINKEELIEGEETPC